MRPYVLSCYPIPPLRYCKGPQVKMMQMDGHKIKLGTNQRDWEPGKRNKDGGKI